MASEIKLNLGCGEDYKAGYINVDFNREMRADVYEDITKYLQSHFDDSIEEIVLSHVLEHVDNPLEILIEIERVLQKNGKLVLTMPHFNYLDHHRDLTHKRFCTSQTFDPYVQKMSYSTKFEIIKKTFVCPYWTIVHFFGLRFLEIIGYPIYQVTWELKK